MALPEEMALKVQSCGQILTQIQILTPYLQHIKAKFKAVMTSSVRQDIVNFESFRQNAITRG